MSNLTLYQIMVKKRAERMEKQRKFRHRLINICLISLAFFCALDAKKDLERYYARFEVDLFNMGEEAFFSNFRLYSYKHFEKLVAALRLPRLIRCDNGVVVSREFALAVVLRRLAYPCRWTDLIELLGRERTQLARIFNTTVDLLWDLHGYLLESLKQPWLSADDMEEYADAVFSVTGRYENCFGFIDGTARPICRPSFDQEAHYSGHCKTHVIKFLSIMLPNGIIAWLWGPEEGRRHDGWMVTKSDLCRQLRARNVTWGANYCVYGDKGFAETDVFHTPFKGHNIAEAEREMNRDMTLARLSVEYGFGKVTQKFAANSMKENQQVLWQMPAKTYKVSVLLTNCLTCMYKFPLVQDRFHVEPPNLRFYLRVPGATRDEPVLNENKI